MAFGDGGDLIAFVRFGQPQPGLDAFALASQPSRLKMNVMSGSSASLVQACDHVRDDGAGANPAAGRRPVQPGVDLAASDC